MFDYGDGFGNLIVVADTMDRGKTSAVGALSKGAQRFKHIFDVARSQTTDLWTHDGRTFSGDVAHSAYDLKTKLNLKKKKFAFDEGEFFDAKFADLVWWLLLKGKDVFLGYLNRTALKIPFPFADYGNINVIYAMRTFGGEERDFDFGGAGHWRVPTFDEHYQCRHMDEHGRQCERLGFLPHRLLSGQSVAYDAPLIAVGGMKKDQEKPYYENRCPFHAVIPGEQEHFAIRDLARLLAWNNSFFGPLSVAINSVGNFSKSRLSEILDRYYQMEADILSIPNLKPAQITKLGRIRVGISQAELFQHPEIGRMHLFDDSSLDQKILNLENNHELRHYNGIILP
jgi:thymidine kinase